MPPKIVDHELDDVGDYDQYGLTEPVCTFRITADVETYTVELGDFSKMDEQRCFSIGDGKAYLISHDPLDEFDVVLRDMILDDAIPAFDTVKQIAFSGAENYTITYDENGTSICAGDVYFTDEELQTFGLDGPALSVALDYSSSDEGGNETDSGTLVLHLSAFFLLFVAAATEFSDDTAIIAAKYRFGEFFMKKTTWIARTAVCLALLIAVQFFTKSLGQFVTGSCVNLVLAIASLIGGVWSGVTVAVISPFCAYLLGIGPAFLPMVPCISLGNAVYAVLFGLLVGKYLQKKKLPAAYGSMVLAAAAKFVTLYVVLVRLVAPAVVPAAKLSAVTASFTWPQLITAAIGGVLACLIAPVLRRALEKKS